MQPQRLSPDGSVRRSRVAAYGGVGLLLALGAPTGWLGFRLATAGLSFREEIAHYLPWYAYLTVGTTAAFTTFGLVLGFLAERLADAARRFEELALSDALTGLRNRRYFEERLVAECARADREGRPLSLVAIDLDQFKRINDAYGHPFGDRVLVHVARILKQSGRLGDVACRTGGEEFAILCPGADANAAASIGERFRLALGASPVLSPVGVSVSMTASVGVGPRALEESAEALLLDADDALYEAKRAGRNRVIIASDSTVGAGRRALGAPAA